MAAAAAGGAALDGSRPNPSDDAPRQRSPPGKGKKPVALADISNTGRHNNTRSLSVADVVKENAMLVEQLKEKTRTIEQCKAEIQKLRFTLQSMHQQNKQFAQAHSQMLAELNHGKDRIKALQQEVSCNAALLKEKDAAGVSHQIDASVKGNLKEIQEACSSLPEIGAHQIGDTTSNTKRSLSAETQSSLPFNIAEPPKALEDRGNERGTSKQKLKNGKGSAIEHTSAKCDASALHEDVICPLPQSSSNASMEQKINQKQTDIQTQMAGRRRPLRRTAKNVVSYKEPPVNAKMRRP